jgi:hypothetical protein
VSPAYSTRTPTSVSSPLVKGFGSGTAGGTRASSQTTAVGFLPTASERRSEATLAKALTVWVACFRSVPGTRRISKFSSSSVEPGSKKGVTLYHVGFFLQMRLTPLRAISWRACPSASMVRRLRISSHIDGHA